MKVVATYREAYLAHLARGQLEAEGLPAIVTDEHLVNANWVLSNAIGGVKVQVADADFERASQLLQPTEETQIEARACPHCGATSVSRRYSRWSILPSLALQLPVFFGKKWTCNDCGDRW